MGLVHSKSLGFSSGEWFNTDVGQLLVHDFSSFYIKFSNCYLQKNPIYLPDPHTKSPLEKENGFHSPHLTGVTSFSCHPPLSQGAWNYIFTSGLFHVVLKDSLCPFISVLDSAQYKQSIQMDLFKIPLKVVDVFASSKRYYV